MKKIDSLLMRSFVVPFVMTFFIAIFVLLMQFLWLYIEDIVGKGVSVFVIIEIIFYLSISLFQMALPIAVLISSVMVMGNLAEHYELSTMKSAGMPLLRVMAPLMISGGIVAVFSFITANNLMPVSNLKYKSRLYDIRKQKPTLSLEEGIFNDDFQSIVIQFDGRTPDGNTMENVKIYDHKNDKGRYNAITAESGRLVMSEDQRYMTMRLFDGNQYQETTKSKMKSGDPFPFIRTRFSEWNKVLDLSEFDLKLTDEDLFKSHRTMLSGPQILADADTLQNKIDKKKEGLAHYSNSFIHLLKDEPKPKKPHLKTARTDTGDDPDEPEENPQKQKIIQQAKKDLSKKPKTKKKGIKTPVAKYKMLPIRQALTKPITDYENLLPTFVKHKQLDLLKKAEVTVRSIQSQTVTVNRNIKSYTESKIKHYYEYHNRMAMAFICFVFVFLGAPMGAIVRKGGFGFPILIAIIFFMSFIVIRMTFENLAEKSVMPVALAAWMPVFILFPIGIFLTVKAMNDSKILNFDSYRILIDKIIVFFKKRFGKKEELTS